MLLQSRVLSLLGINSIYPSIELNCVSPRHSTAKMNVTEVDTSQELQPKPLPLHPSPGQPADTTADAPPPPTVLTFKDLTLKTSGGQVLLNGVSARIGPGLTAVMGPTGAGKTNLLNCLADQIPSGLQMTGERRINGKPYTASKVHYGYVLQTDDFNGNLTVQETLSFAAELMLANAPVEQREHRVEYLLKELGLYHVRDVMIGTPLKKGISGGQRKRVSIALAMINAPKLMFLDEPTAGLDSVTAMNLLLTLKQLARQEGATLLCVIHQPQKAIYGLLDRVLLVRSTEIIHDGKASDVVAYFESLGYPYEVMSNPADFIMEVISPTVGESMEDLTARCEVRKHYRAPELNLTENESVPLPLPVTPPTLATQFAILFRRQIIQEVRDVNLHLMSVTTTSVAAILIGLVWFSLGSKAESMSKRLPAVFFCAVNQSLFGAMKAVLAFPGQRAMMSRERRAKMYSTSPAFLAWAVVDFLYTIPWSLLFSGITYVMLGLRSDAGAFFLFALFMFLDRVAGASIAMMICAVFEESVAVVVLPALLELSRLFSGYFLSPRLLPQHYVWLDPLSYVKYAYVGSALNELNGLMLYTTGIPSCSPLVTSLGGGTLSPTRLPVVTNVNGSVFTTTYQRNATHECSTMTESSMKTTQATIDRLGLNFITVGGCVGALFAMVIGTRIIAYCFVRMKKL